VIGDILLEKTENSGELFGGDMGEYKKAKEDKGGDAEMMCEKGEEGPDEAEAGEGEQKQADQADDVQVIFLSAKIDLGWSVKTAKFNFLGLMVLVRRVLKILRLQDTFCKKSWRRADWPRTPSAIFSKRLRSAI
jgi:hypothetical protein